MQKVVGSNPISRFPKRPAFAGLFRCSSRVSASASLDNDWTIVSVATRGRGRKVLFSRRFRATSTWELLRPCRDRESTAPGRCSCPRGTLRLVRGRSAAFVGAVTLRAEVQFPGQSLVRSRNRLRLGSPRGIGMASVRVRRTQPSGVRENRGNSKPLQPVRRTSPRFSTECVPRRRRVT
jgi:hypothetical protein